MERVELDDDRLDELRLSVDEAEDLDGEIGPDIHGHFKETFRRIVIELPGGLELTFSGYGGKNEPVSLAVDGPGRNQKSCIDCEEEKSDWVLNPISKQGGPTLYVCDDCKDDSLIYEKLLR